MRPLIASIALLAAPAAWACGLDLVDESLPAGLPLPTASEVDVALEAAAVEFGVPEPLLAIVAWSESRWRHDPYRISAGERRGVFQLPTHRIEEAADALGLAFADVMGDVDQHARAFAWLLASERPRVKGGVPSIGRWRDALGFAEDLDPDTADRWIDGLFERLDDGVIERLPTGEPVTIAPVAVEPQFRGLWASTAGRSADYGPATWDAAAACNYSNSSRGPGDVDYVIIHTAQGSYNGTISWFKNCSASVSAHYVVSTGGAITQMVREEDVGWHVSCWNGRTVGIEHEGYAQDPGLWYTPAMYQASALLVRDILQSWGLPADRNHVLGHVEIDPACNGNAHWDPGNGWDWNGFMQAVTGAAVNTTELVGYIRHDDLYNAANGLAGATVDVPGIGTTTTGADGWYEFSQVTPGTYTICASAAGYDTGCRSKDVQANITNWGSIALYPPTGDDDDTGDDDTAGDDDTGDDDTGDDDTGDDDTGDDDTGDDDIGDDDTGDDDTGDDDTGDDDTGDDDTAGDDDSAGDDDTGDEPWGAAPALGGTRRSLAGDASGCRGDIGGGALLLLPALRRRRRRVQEER